MTEYDTGVIYNLLTESFEPADLYRLCRDNKALRPITMRVTRTTPILTMADAVVDYCRQQAILDELLRAVCAANRGQFERFAPRLGPGAEDLLRDYTDAEPTADDGIPPRGSDPAIPPPRDTEPPLWKTVLSKPIVWLVLAALILLVVICLLFYKPPAVTVALETTHGRYVTAMADNWDPPWVLRAGTRVPHACEEFTLLCQCGGQVALQTCQETETGKGYVTAMGGDHDWLLTGKTDVKVLFERFTILDADTEERRSCREVIKALEENDQISVAFRTWRTKEGKRRLWTAMDGSWHQPWVLRAGTYELGPSEIFTMTLLP